MTPAPDTIKDAVRAPSVPARAAGWGWGGVGWGGLGDDLQTHKSPLHPAREAANKTRSTRAERDNEPPGHERAPAEAQLPHARGRGRAVAGRGGVPRGSVARSRACARARAPVADASQGRRNSPP